MLNLPQGQPPRPPSDSTKKAADTDPNDLKQGGQAILAFKYALKSPDLKRKYPQKLMRFFEVLRFLDLLSLSAPN